jgi:hypothetical protein
MDPQNQLNELIESEPDDNYYKSRIRIKKKRSHSEKHIKDLNSFPFRGKFDCAKKWQEEFEKQEKLFQYIEDVNSLQKNMNNKVVYSGFYCVHGSFCMTYIQWAKSIVFLNSGESSVEPIDKCKYIHREKDQNIMHQIALRSASYRCYNTRIRSIPMYCPRDPKNTPCLLQESIEEYLRILEK